MINEILIIQETALEFHGRETSNAIMNLHKSEIKPHIYYYPKRKQKMWLKLDPGKQKWIKES
jgi:hypothetical protein